MTDETKNIFPLKKTPAGPGAWAFVIGIAIVYVLLHGGTLELTGLWHEEVLTFRAAEAGSVTDAIRYSITDDHTGLVYNIAAAIAVAVAGPYDRVIRFPALVFGALCIVALFALMRRTSPDGSSLFGPLLLFGFASLLFISTEARGYSLAVLLNLLLVIAVLQYVEIKTYNAVTRAGIVFFVALWTDPVSAGFTMTATVISVSVVSPKSFRDGKPPGAITFLTSMVLVLIIQLISSKLLLNEFISSTSFWRSLPRDASLANKTVMAYIAASGGITPGNTTAAFACLPALLYGAIHHFRANSRGALFVLVFAAASLGISVLSSIPSLTFVPAASKGFVMSIVSITALWTGSALYYYFKTTFRRDASSVFSISLLIRMAVTGLILLMSFIGILTMFITTGSKAHSWEKQNWRAPIRKVIEKYRPGDVLMFRSQDTEPVNFYLERAGEDSIKTIDINDPLKLKKMLERSPSSWLLIREQTGLPAAKKESHALQRMFPSNSTVYGGLLGDIILIRFDGYFAGDTLEFKISGNPLPEESRIAIACDPREEPCGMNIYFPERDVYDFEIIARGSESAAVSICDVLFDVAETGPGPITFESEVMQSSCRVDISLENPPGDGMIFTVHKRNSFDSL